MSCHLLLPRFFEMPEPGVEQRLGIKSTHEGHPALRGDFISAGSFFLIEATYGLTSATTTQQHYGYDMAALPFRQGQCSFWNNECTAVCSWGN